MRFCESLPESVHAVLDPLPGETLLYLYSDCCYSTCTHSTLKQRLRHSWVLFVTFIPIHCLAQVDLGKIGRVGVHRVCISLSCLRFGEKIMKIYHDEYNIKCMCSSVFTVFSIVLEWRGNEL